MSTYDYINTSMQYKLHSVLKLTDFWPQFIEAIAEEVALIKDNDEQTKYYNDIYTLLEDGNLNIASKFGYTPNLVLNNSLDYVRQQSESIPFRVQKKTTYLGYDINFKMVERIGEIYNLFWNGSKLIKAIKWGSTFSALESGFDYTLPFTSLIADRNFSTINLGNTELMDDDNYLDEDPPLRMDSSTYVYPTKHLAVEYITDQLTSRDSIDYLYYDNYFKYLEQGSEYNRQVPVIAHNGCQLNIVTSASGGYDFFNVGGTYSVPILELKSAVTFLYIIRETIQGLLSLDDVGRTLDEPIIWTMDGSNEASVPISLNDFKYISVGGGTQVIPNTEQSRILNDLSTLVVYYPMDDEDYLTTVKDFSSNNYTATITGVQRKVPGIIGKTVAFDGFTNLQSTITLIEGDYNFGMWTQLDNTVVNQYIFDFDFIKLSYSFTTGLLTLHFNALTQTVSVDMTDIHFIELEVDMVNEEVRVFIDTSLTATLDITGESFGGEYDLYIGSDSSSSNKAKGIIDDFHVYIKNFTQTEKDYLYTNRVGIITKLDRFYNRAELQEVEKNENTGLTWLGVQSYNKAKYLNDEFAFSYSTGVHTYIGTTNFQNHIPFRTALNYTRIEGITPVIEKLYDNGDGYFEGTHISGSIDYTTGTYTIYDYSINRELYDVLSPTPITIITNAVSPFVELGTFQLVYEINGTSYIAQDDTAGNIVGTGITTGTIDYITGVVNITFVEETDGEVSCRYQYKKTAVFNNADIIMIEYYSEDTLEVTEIALENEDKEVLVYATFPPIEFNTIENYLSSSFFIRKV